MITLGPRPRPACSRACNRAEPACPPASPRYDLHSADTFWAEHLGAAFQTVASDVDRDLSDYRAAMDAINSGTKLDTSGDAALADTTRALASSINALPELQAKKALIDCHMNLATELLALIRARCHRDLTNPTRALDPPPPPPPSTRPAPPPDRSGGERLGARHEEVGRTGPRCSPRVISRAISRVISDARPA